MGLVQEHDVAQDLGDMSAGLCSQLGGGFVAVDGGRVDNLYFDQFMIQEGLGHRGNLSFADAIFANLRERRQRVSQRAEVSSLLAR